MKTIKICLFSTVKAEIFELCVMLTYLWQLTPSVHLRTTVSKQSWLLWSHVRHHSVHSVYKQYSELSHSRWSCLIHPSQVTSAGKAVDCAVISTRGNMTTRPTAQTTTSTRAWPPGSLCLFRLSSLASLRSKCLVQSVSLCVKAHEKNMACAQKRGRNKARQKPHPKKKERKKKKHTSCTVPIFPAPAGLLRWPQWKWHMAGKDGVALVSDTADIHHHARAQKIWFLFGNNEI